MSGPFLCAELRSFWLAPQALAPGLQSMAKSNCDANPSLGPKVQYMIIVKQLVNITAGLNGTK